MKILFHIVIVLMLASGGYAGELFVLQRNPGYEQGIMRIDPSTGKISPFAALAYSGTPNLFSPLPMGDGGNLHLTALSDRVILQGQVFHEFDLGSGQLLRRYPAIGGVYVDSGWAFQGVAVDRTFAAAAGIEPGFYGNVRCPSGMHNSCGGPRELFPGYTRQGLTDPDVFLRRGLDPGDTSLTVVKILSPSTVGPVDTIRERYAAFDSREKRFLFSLGGKGGSGVWFSQVTASTIVAGQLGQERIELERRWKGDDPVPLFAGPGWITYDPSDTSLVQVIGSKVARFKADRSIEVITESASPIDSITAVPLETSDRFVQLLQAVGESAGVNGTYWRTDAWLFNPSDSAMDVRLRRVNRSEGVKQVTLGPRGSLKIANLLREMGGGPGGDGTTLDAVVLDSPHRAGSQLSVYARNYTPSPAGGTYGHALPAVPSLVGYSNHVAPELRNQALAETASVLILDTGAGRHFRHNLGVVNADDQPLYLRLQLEQLSGSPSERRLDIPPNSMRQVSLESLFSNDIVESRSSLLTVHGDRPAAIYLALIDNRTGDASFLPFTQYAIGAGPSARLALPGVTFAPGANGTFWRTDAYGIFSQIDGEQQKPDANFYLATGVCAGAAAGFKLTPQIVGHPYWTTSYYELARQACPDSAEVSGAMEIRTGSWMSAYARTYTTRADGGTYGDILPLYPPRGWPSRHFAGIEFNDAFRVNFGLYNGSDEPSKIGLRLYDASGTLAASVEIALLPRMSTQNGLRALFAGNLPDGVYGLSVTTLEGVGSWPYVSTVDNITGDPTNWW